MTDFRAFLDVYPDPPVPSSGRGCTRPEVSYLRPERFAKTMRDWLRWLGRLEDLIQEYYQRRKLRADYFVALFEAQKRVYAPPYLVDFRYGEISWAREVDYEKNFTPLEVMALHADLQRQELSHFCWSAKYRLYLVRNHIVRVIEQSLQHWCWAEGVTSDSRYSPETLVTFGNLVFSVRDRRGGSIAYMGRTLEVKDDAGPSGGP